MKILLSSWRMTCWVTLHEFLIVQDFANWTPQSRLLKKATDTHLFSFYIEILRSLGCFCCSLNVPVFDIVTHSVERQKRSLKTTMDCFCTLTEQLLKSCTVNREEHASNINVLCRWLIKLMLTAFSFHPSKWCHLFLRTS